MKLLMLSAAVVTALPLTLQAQNFVDLAHAFYGNKDSTFDYIGQSFVASATADQITFNFYNGSSAPIAQGTGYLFSQAYTGSPAALGSSAAGLLAEATADPDHFDGKYTFDPSFTLQQGVKYFFYEVSPAIGLDSSYGETLANSEGFFANSSTGDFASMPESFNFQVDGITTTPEPSALLLLGSGLLGGVGMLGRRLVH